MDELGGAGEAGRHQHVPEDQEPLVHQGRGDVWVSSFVKSAFRYLEFSCPVFPMKKSGLPMMLNLTRAEDEHLEDSTPDPVWHQCWEVVGVFSL